MRNNLLSLFRQADSQFSTTPRNRGTVLALWHLQKIILDTLDFNQVVQRIVDGLLVELGYLQLGYRIIVLTLVDEKTQKLRRISLSSTEEAKKAQEVSAVPFHDIEIPLSANDNLLIKVLTSKTPAYTHEWPEIFTPILTPEEALRNQSAAGIRTSMLYPVILKEKAIGVLIFSMVKDVSEVSEEEKELIAGFTDIVAIAVQNSQLYSSLQEAMHELELTNQRLEQLDKLKDEFVSLASHELRTPMTVIKSYLWLLLQEKRGPLTPQQKSDLEKSYQSTERLINLVNDMLNISRIESGRFEVNLSKVNGVELVQSTVSELQARAVEQQIQLIYENYIKTDYMIMADVERVKQVLINLIGNSLKFTPQNGSIRVTTTSDDNYLTVCIKDTGKGIKKEDIPKLFQKFGIVGNKSLTKLNSQGTGLGLYLSKALIELQNGKIWVESEGEERGATFCFTLPRVNMH